MRKAARQARRASCASAMWPTSAPALPTACTRNGIPGSARLRFCCLRARAGRCAASAAPRRICARPSAYTRTAPSRPGSSARRPGPTTNRCVPTTGSPASMRRAACSSPAPARSAPTTSTGTGPSWAASRAGACRATPRAARSPRRNRATTPSLASPTASEPARALIGAQPGLRAAQKREADEAAHLELSAAVGKAHAAAINLAVVRIENFSAGVLLPVPAQPPQDLHAYDRRVLQLAVAFLAQGIRTGRGRREHCVHGALELSVDLDDAHQPVGFPGAIAESAPETGGRRRLSQRGRRGEEQRSGAEPYDCFARESTWSSRRAARSSSCVVISSDGARVITFL